MQRLLVTGGAGFIGSNFVRMLLREHPEYRVRVLDKLTYAGNLENLADLEGHPRYEFVRGDIADPVAVREAIRGCDAVVNIAAETHVDRSLLEPAAFITTNVYGTYTLLEAARDAKVERFVQVSTDEVYGPIMEGSSDEEYPIRPSSPYSASKAGGDALAHAFWTTFGLPVTVTRGSNNFGPYQFPEKMIPLFISNALEGKPLPIYGDGLQVRDWIYVLDHCSGIDCVLHHGEPGEVYNIGGGNERTNLEVSRALLRILERPLDALEYVRDRPGHDRRYSLDCGKLTQLGWAPRHDFEEALAETVRWYCENQGWWKRIRSGEYQEYYRKMYEDREVTLSA